MMGRRHVLIWLSSVLAAPAALAQGPARSVRRLWRVAILRPSGTTDTERIESSLRALGYEPGRDVTIDSRFADGDVARLPALARDLVQQNPDVVIAVGEAASRALRSASVTMPLIIFGNFDPVAAGLAQSLARPGRDTTGVMISSEGTLAGKKLELLKEAVPGLQRIGVLIPQDSAVRTQIEEIRRAAAVLALEVVFVEVHGSLYQPAFAEFADHRVGAVLVAAHTFFVRDRRAIIDLAQSTRLPAIYEWPDQVRDGGLMSYGPPSLDAMWQRIAEYVDRILKGTRAGDLPIVLPFRLELAINLRAARAIDFTMPPALLARATEVID